MRKKILFILIVSFVAFVMQSNAQVTLSPKVICAQGGKAVSGTLDLSWTLGEPFYTTLTNGSVMLTQGFEQPYLSACTPPATQASGLSSSLVTQTTATVSLATRGDGTGGVIIVGYPGASAGITPTPGTSYTANTIYGSVGSALGTGFVVYKSNAAAPVNVNVTNLAAGTQYTFVAYEYNSSGICYNITVTATTTFTTCSLVGIAATPTGATSVCPGSINTYSTSGASGAATYVWTLPGGWSGTSTTTSIIATAGASGGNITVHGVNSCGNAGAESLPLVVAQAFYTTTFSVSGPGSISGPSSVACNSTPSYTFTNSDPSCHSLTDVKVDGVSQGAVNPYTFPVGVTANHTITGVFTINTYTVEVTQTPNGNISSATPDNIGCNDPKSYTITANTDYHIASVTVDGASLTGPFSNSYNYTFDHITTNNHSITATYAQNDFTITVSAGSNGSISNSPSVDVNPGSDKTFIITPAQCYHILDVLADGNSDLGNVTINPLTGVGAYTFNNVVANHTISATFALTEYVIDASTSDNNGTIASLPDLAASSGGPFPITKDCGGTYTFSVAANTDYEISDIIIDGSTHLGPFGPLVLTFDYSFSNLTGNHTIVASFRQQAKNYYPITGATDLSNISQWTDQEDGSAGVSPTAFTDPDQRFNIFNNPVGTTGFTILNPWAVSGTNTYVQVGNGTDAYNFNIPAGAAYNNAPGATSIDVKANATLVIANTTIPPLGTLTAPATTGTSASTGFSKVNFNGTANQNIPAHTYGDLIVNVISGASASCSSLTVTMTTAVPHGYTTGQTIIISGFVPTGYNSITNKVITVTGPNTFTYPVTTCPGVATILGTVSNTTNLLTASLDGNVQVNRGLNINSIIDIGANTLDLRGQLASGSGNLTSMISAGVNGFLTSSTGTGTLAIRGNTGAITSAGTVKFSTSGSPAAVGNLGALIMNGYGNPVLTVSTGLVVNSTLQFAVSPVSPNAVAAVGGRVAMAANTTFTFNGTSFAGSPNFSNYVSLPPANPPTAKFHWNIPAVTALSGVSQIIPVGIATATPAYKPLIMGLANGNTGSVEIGFITNARNAAISTATNLIAADVSSNNIAFITLGNNTSTYPANPAAGLNFSSYDLSMSYVNGDFLSAVTPDVVAIYRWSDPSTPVTGSWLRIGVGQNSNTPSTASAPNFITKNNIILTGNQYLVLGKPGGDLPDGTNYFWSGANGSAWNDNQNWKIYSTASSSYITAAAYPNDVDDNATIDNAVIVPITNDPILSTTVAVNNFTINSNTLASTGYLKMLGAFTSTVPSASFSLSQGSTMEFAQMFPAVQTVYPLNYGHLKFTGTASFDFDNSATTGIAGVFTIPTNFNVNNNTISFNGSGFQNIPVFPYYNLQTATGSFKIAQGSITVENDLTIGLNSTFAGGGFSHTIGHNWVNNNNALGNSGGFTSTGSTINFNAGSSVSLTTIGGTASTPFENIVVNRGTDNTVTHRVIGPMSMSGSLTLNTGIFQLSHPSAFANQPTSPLTSAVALIIDGGTMNAVGSSDISINSGSSVTVSGGALNVGGRLAPDAGASVTLSAGAITVGAGTGVNSSSATFDMNSGANFTWNGGNIILKERNGGTGGDFMVASGGIKSISLSNNDTLKVGAGTTGGGIYLLSSALAIPNLHIYGLHNPIGRLATNSLAVNGSVLINSGGSIDAGTNGKDIALGGNWTNDGSFTEGSGSTKVAFNNASPGTTPQNINGSAVTQFNNLVISNGFHGVTLSSVNTQVKGTLNFISGIITTGSSNRVIITSGGNVTGGGNGWVNGTLQKNNIGSGLVSKIFEVGGPTVYSPAQFDFTGLSAGGDFAVTNIENTAPLLTHSFIIEPSATVKRYWKVHNMNNAGFTSADITFNFVSGDYTPADFTQFYVDKTDDNGTSWMPFASRLNIQSRSSTSIKSTGLASPFTIASPSIFAIGVGRDGSCPITVPIINNSGSTTFCEGGSVTLSVTNYDGDPATSYAWSNGASGTSISVTQSGIYTATAYNSDINCSTIASNAIIVTVNAHPTAVITSADTDICPGDNTTLSGTITASGLWTLTLSNGQQIVNGSGSIFSFTISPGTDTHYILTALSDSKCNAIGAGLTGSMDVHIDAPPTVVCHADITQNTDAGNCTAVVNYATTTTGDPAPSVSYIFSGATGGSGSGTGTGSTFNKGTTLVTITVTNKCGTSSCSFNVTVEDHEAPVISCVGPQTRSSDLNACSYTTSGTEFDPASFADNCTGSTVSNDYNNSSSLAGAVFPKGPTTVVWTVTDASGFGNSATCSVIVTVEDHQNPTISCIGDQIRSSDNNTCSYTAIGTEFDPASYGDNCSGETVSNSLNGLASLSGYVFPKGSTTVVWTVTDASGFNNIATCSFVVTVEDHQNPTISCAGAQTRSSDLNTCTYTTVGTEFDPASFADNCPGSTINNDFNNSSSLAGAVFPKGPTTIVWTVTDASGFGNTATCSFVVMVEDHQAPTIACAFSGTVDRDANTSGCVYNPGTSFDPLTFDDNCSGSSIAFTITGAGATPSSGNGSLDGVQFNLGTSTINWVVTDGSGNTASCSFSVTVHNHVADVISFTNPGPQCRNGATIDLSPYVFPAVSGGGSFSGPGITGTNFDPTAAGVILGVNNITYQYQDPATGCFDSRTVGITVNTPPTVSAGNYIAQCSGGAPLTLVGNPVGGVFSGPGVTGSAGNYIFTPSSVTAPGTYTVTYTYTANNNCSNSATTNIVVNVCSYVITATAGANGSISPSGSVSVLEHASQTFNITPATCYIISQILVDGAPVAIASSFTFTNVQAAHTIDVTFAPDPTMQSFAATGISSNRAFNNICNGGSITLTKVGGTLAAGAQWVWYQGGCGSGSPVATGSTLTVFATSSTDYYVRAEGGTCNVLTTCVSTTVQVSNGKPNCHLTIDSVPGYGYAGASGRIAASPCPGATFYHWTSNGHDMLFDGQAEPYESAGPGVTATYIITRSNYVAHVYAGNACGRTNTATSQGIRGNVAPATGGITGNLLACQGTSLPYTSGAIANTVGYWWSITTVPANTATITGNGSQNITVNFLTGFQSATLCVNGRTSFNLDGPQTCIQISSTPPVPGTVSGPSTVCTGSNQTYTATGASSYSWTTSVGTFVGSSTGSTVVIAFPGTSFTNQQVCAYAVACGHASVTAACMTVNSTPGASVGPIHPSTAGDTVAVCGKSNVGYDVPSNPLISLYTWSVPAGASIASGQGSNSITVDFSNSYAPGNISVVATFPCGTANASLLVRGNPSVPTIDPAGPYCQGSDGVINVAANGGASSPTFYWNLPSTFDFQVLSGDSSQVYVIWDASGTVQARNSCGLSYPLNLVVNPCRLEEDAVKGAGSIFYATIYPNPASGKATLSFNGIASNYHLELLDMTGRVVITKEGVSVEGLNSVDLDLNNLAKGMYMMNLTLVDHTKQIRLAVQ